MRLVWLVILVCCCMHGCDDDDEKKPDRPYVRSYSKAIFQTDKISKEVGELFSVAISLVDDEGNPIELDGDTYHRYRNLYVQEKQLTQLASVDSPTDSMLRASFRDGEVFIPTSPPPPRNRGRVSSDGKTIHFEHLFYLEEVTTTLTIEASQSQIPFEIISNSGVAANSTLNTTDSKLVVKITGGDANHTYQIFQFPMMGAVRTGLKEAGKVTLDAEGKGEVNIPMEIPDYRCSLSFQFLLKASEGDNSRVVSQKVEVVPCFVSDGGTVQVTDDGSLTFTDKSYHSCSSTSAKKISWSYAHSSDYTKLSEGGTLERVNPNAQTVDLGKIANYDANACYLVVVKSACLGDEDSQPTKKKVGNGC